MADLYNIIMHRRSIRRYSEKQIEEDVLEKILEAGMYAPSAGGRQGVLFAVCQNKEMNERLGRIKRAHSRPRMADATHYVSKEQPSIAMMPLLQMPSMMPLQSLLSSPLRISYFLKKTVH